MAHTTCLRTTPFIVLPFKSYDIMSRTAHAHVLSQASGLWMESGPDGRCSIQRTVPAAYNGSLDGRLWLANALSFQLQLSRVKF